MFLQDGIVICPADIVTALRANTIGSKVTNEGKFWAAVTSAIKKFDWSTCRTPGQAFIMTPEAVPYVSAGVGKRTTNPDDYVLREHRGRVDAYLKRSHAASVDDCAIVVYTIDAFGKDPEVDQHTYEVYQDLKMTHILVAVLAFSGPQSPLGVYRFVSNLGGGNNEALTYTADDIRSKAKTIIEYDSEWCVVAD